MCPALGAAGAALGTNEDQILCRFAVGCALRGWCYARR
ncbi:hypothetical protein A2U01_0076541, partial [Trifolium medium]|nr:hypothetical protein [Trifolium medium]